MSYSFQSEVGKAGILDDMSNIEGKSEQKGTETGCVNILEKATV